MTKDDIGKLLTPETTLIFEKSRFCPSGNKSCWEDYSKLERHARSLEQQRDAAVMALEAYIDHEDSRHDDCPICDDVKSSLAAIKELSK